MNIEEFGYKLLMGYEIVALSALWVDFTRQLLQMIEFHLSAHNMFVKLPL